MTITFEGVSIIPMDRERVVDGQTVVVEGDRIAWIGAEGDADIPPGAVRIDARGKYLMPGLADMHTHPCSEDDLLLLIAHGVTTIRNLEGLPRHVLWRERVEAGQLLGPTIHTSGPIVDGRPVRSNGSLSVVERDEAVAAVGQTERGRYSSVKVYDQLSVEAYRWVAAAARDRGLPVVGHIPFQVGLHGALDAGQRSIEHLYGYPQALQPASRQASGPRDLTELRAWLFDQALHAEIDRIPELAEATRAAGTWNCPTLIVRTRWIKDPAALAALPEMRYLSPVQAVHANYFMNHYPKEAASQSVCELNAALVRGLHAAGAGLLVGTDAGIPGVVYGASVHEELQAFVDAGLSPFEALRAATCGPATFLEEAGQWGEIIVGARADMLLLDANPLADVSHATRRAGVMLRGRWLPQSELAEMLADLGARRQEPFEPRSHSTSPASTPSHSERLRFSVSWAGWEVGEDEIVAEHRGSDGRRILATTSVEGLGTAVAFEAGTYRAEVSVDADGIDQAAWFEYDGNDGVDRVDITRTDGLVRIQHSQATGDQPDREIPDPDATALFGRPLTALYARLAERLAGLEIGDEIDVRVVGPGLPPDLTVNEATLHATRLAATDADDDGARYAVEFRRPNVTTAALLTCDAENRPVRLDLSSDMGYWHRNAAQAEPDPASVVRVSRVT